MSAKINQSENKGCRTMYLHNPFWIVFATMVFSLMSIKAHGQYALCFPSTTWFGSPTGPVIDGKVVGDDGWRGAIRYVFGNGTSDPDVVIQGIRVDSTGNLYLSIGANHLSSLTSGFDPKTVVLITFDNKLKTGNRYHQIQIKPVRAGISAGQIANDPLAIVGGDAGPSSYWTAPDAATPAWSSISPIPSWLGVPNNPKVGYFQGPVGSYHWFLELKVPFIDTDTGEVIIPSSGNFSLYLNIFRVDGGVFHESWWPPTQQAYEVGCDGISAAQCTPHTLTPLPSPSAWGASTVDSSSSLACGGVSVGSQVNNIFAGTESVVGGSVIFTPHSPNSKISLDQPNTFRAYIQNTSKNGSGIDIAAGQIKAMFRIANWGIASPADWKPVPTTGPTPPPPIIVKPNPTDPKDIPASVCASSTKPTDNSDLTCILQSGPWQLAGPVGQSGTEANIYANANAGHQCVLVEIDAAPTSACGPSTPEACPTIVNNTAVQNMDFGIGASKFERVAEISARGYPARLRRADGTSQPDQLFDLHVTMREEVVKPDGMQSVQGVSSSAAPQAMNRGRGKTEGRIISQLTWIVHGCRHTGRYMTVDEQTLELCDDVGAFGYVIRHVGSVPVEKWAVAFTGQGLEKVSGSTNNYRLRVPYNGVATVTTRVEPKEQGAGKWGAFADLGAAIPNGTFGDAFNTGFSLNAGLEYMVNSYFSAEGILGYHRFGGKFTDAMNVIQFSGGAKVYSSSFGGSNRVFARGGIGGYHFTIGPSTDFGGYVGGGVLHEFNAHLGLEGVYTFHAVNTSGGATKFSTVQGGVRWAF